MVEVKGDCKIGSKAGYESFGGAKTRKGLKNFQLKGDGIEGLQVVDKITIYGGAIKDPRARGGPEKIHRITPGLLLIKVEV